VGKFALIVDEVKAMHALGRPVLIGTRTIDKSEELSRLLDEAGLPHTVLNARQIEREAEIVSQAGQRDQITVSTNMAGRGTDILLGGNAEMMAKLEFKEQNRIPEAEPEEFEKAVEALKISCAAEGDEIRKIGGLYILGTERHESRRIDNQLRGRAGRQGDPGASRFYLSLEDDLMRIFAGDRVKNLMERMGMPDNEPIIHPWVTRSVENAQKKVEERNFDIRKNLLEYDDVMSSQRQTVYRLRQELLTGRYTAEELDEEGRSTGEVRRIEPSKKLAASVRPEIAALLGMFCEEPLMPRDAEGNDRPIERKQFEGAKLVEVETFQKEVYSRWGVVVETSAFAKVRSALDIYDELVAAIPRSLAEQRDRLLDLIDRIVGAIVEESCPANRPPDDWAWADIFEGIERHFGLAVPEEVSENGDREALAQELYELAEKAYVAREKEFGLELSLRVFRHIYLEELDKAWVDHLTDMDHLRDGIGLRGYGQKDPKQEYKKEGYNLFVTMLARVSGSVVAKVMSAKVRRAEDEAQIEAQDLQRHVDELARALAQHGGDDEPVQPPGMFVPAAPAVTSEMDCPCGSGNKFSECHGAPDDAEEASV
jgi:preprotein translocase subunit SecA